MAETSSRSWRNPLHLSRFRLIIVAILIIAGLTLSVYAYAFTSLGRSAGTCPPLHLMIGNQNTGNVPFNIVSEGEMDRPYLGTGTIVWCIYGSSGSLERSYVTNRVLGTVASSADGQYLAANGYKVLPGPAGIYALGTVYLFDRNGVMQWNISSTREIFSVHINSNGSVIAANNPGLLYINNQGRVLWNYTTNMVDAAVLANDGADVLAGMTGSTSGGSQLVMFDSQENILWTFAIMGQQFTSTSSVAVSDGHVAAGVASSGYSGTLYYLDLQGTLVWSRHADSDIVNVSFDSGGSTISMTTNWDRVKFDLQGTVISNQTITGY